MRAFNESAAAACVLLLSMGAQIAEAQQIASFDAPDSHYGRSLQAALPEGGKPYTSVIDVSSGFYVADGLTTTSLIGLIVGFGTTAIFFIYAVIMICIDESKRRTRYTNDVKEAKRELMDKYDFDQSAIDNLMKEFEEIDKNRNKPKDESEKQALDEANWAERCVSGFRSKWICSNLDPPRKVSEDRAADTFPIYFKFANKISLD